MISNLINYFQGFDKAYIGSYSFTNQRGGEARLFRAKSSRRAHNPQFSSSNLLPATYFSYTQNHEVDSSNLESLLILPILCNGLLRCLCAETLGMYNCFLIFLGTSKMTLFVDFLPHFVH